MAKTMTPPYSQNIVSVAAVLVNASSFSAANPGTVPTNTVLLATAGANDSVLKSLMICSDDTSPRTVQLWKSADGGTTKYLIGTVVVPALSGTATLVNVDFLGNALMVGLAIDQSGHPIKAMAAGTTLYICVLTAAVTASKTIWFTGIQSNF